MRHRPFPSILPILAFGILSSVSLLGCTQKHAGPASREAVRIDCNERGVYKITGADLERLGVELPSVDAERMALVHHTKSVPFYAEGLGDGRMDPDDALYFFSDGADQDDVTYVNIEKDFYPRTQRFMLRLGASSYEPLRMKPVKVKTPARPEPERYAARTVGGRRHFEKNPIFRFMNVYSNESQAIFETSATAQTDFIFWAEMTQPATDKTSPVAMATFDLPQADLSREVALRVRLYAASNLAGANLEHHVTVAVNGKPVGEAKWSGAQAHETTFRVAPGICQSGNRIEFTLQPPKTTGAATPENRVAIDFVTLDWFEAEYKQATRAEGDQGEFIIGDAAEQKAAGGLALEGFTIPNIRIFDLQAREALLAKPYQAGDVWSVNLERPARPTTLVALSEERVRTPFDLKRVTLQGKFDKPDDCELLILTHPAFTRMLEPLAEWKRSRGLKTDLVEITDLFNEASGGYAGPETLRKYIERVYKGQAKPSLRYVLLVGDSVSVAKYQTFCPAYAYLQSGLHASENYFAAFDKPEGKPMVAVGRISADKPEQVQNAVRKIIDYESGKYAGAWQSKVLTIAASYQWAREDAQVVVNNFVRPNYQAVMMETILTKMEENYHEKVSQQLTDLLNAGSLMTVFFGHGGGSVWEVGPIWRGNDFKRHLFDQERVTQLTNRERLPLVLALTCYTNDFDNPSVRQTLGETFVNSSGGAIAVIGAAGRSLTMMNAQVLQSFLKAVCAKRGRLGDAFRQALVETNSEVANMNYLLLGDPSLEFAFPAPDLKLTDARLEAATGKLTAQVEAPAETRTPATLECTLVNDKEEVISQWQASLTERKGMLTQALGAGKLTGKGRLVIYLKDEKGLGHAGGAGVEPK